MRIDVSKDECAVDPLACCLEFLLEELVDELSSTNGGATEFDASSCELDGKISRGIADPVGEKKDLLGGVDFEF